MVTLHPWVGSALLALAVPAGLAAQASSTGLALRAEHRARVEHLAPDFRAGVGDVTALSLRTLVAAEWSGAVPFVALEIADARVYASDGAPVNTTHVNALDVLAVHAGLRARDVISAGDALEVRAGRLTRDLASRRLLARNVFRNTINAFTGFDAVWRRPSGTSFEALALVPVARRPTAAPELADNALERDRENGDAVLWGVAAGATLAEGSTLQAYVLGYHERDGDVASANRRIVTPGVRLLRPPRPGRLDFQIEAIAQVGTSRTTAAASDVTDLSHRAYSAHGSVGYRFALASAPRVALQYDLASGDRDPGDDTQGRFDPLFGARAFEFGPTGFYGALARSNVSSLALRLEGAPRGSFDLMASYRLAWLASARDAWTTSGARDASGGAGRFLGQQLEARARVRTPLQGLSIDLGAAALVPGSFAHEAGGMEGMTPHLYTQVTFSRARS